MELQYFRFVEKTKMDLMNTYGWNVLEAFKIIDTKDKGSLVYKDFEVLFQRNNKPFTKYHHDAMMRRLDKDSNEQITKNEFCDALLPMDFNEVVTFEENLEKEFYDLIRGPASKLNYFTEDQQDIWNRMGGQDLGVYEDTNHQRKFLSAVLPPSSNLGQPQFGVVDKNNQVLSNSTSRNQFQNHQRVPSNSHINKISYYQAPEQYSNQPFTPELQLNRDVTKKRIYDPNLNVNGSARGSPMKAYRISPNSDPLESIQKEGTTNKPHQTPYANQNSESNILQYSDTNQKFSKSDLISLKAQKQAQNAAINSDYLEKARYFGTPTK